MNIYQKRIHKLRQQFDEWETDALLVTDNLNRRWLTGFTGSAGFVLVTRENAWLGTDFRYWEQAAQQAPDYELFKVEREVKEMPALIEPLNLTRIAIQTPTITVAEFDKLKEIEAVIWQKIGDSVGAFRRIKTEAELDAIQKAAKLADAAMRCFPQIAKPGLSEVALAWELEKFMRENGANGVAFEIIVAAGPNSAMAHHRPGERLLQIGDPIIVDLGAKLDGFHSDLTRTFHLGSEPSEQFWQVYNVVAEAERAAIAGIRPGMTGKEADAIARDIINEAGYKEQFGHSLGHGVGLDIHERPKLSKTNEGKLNAGNVVTIEPGVYIPGWGGVRIEDLAVLTTEGVHLLSHCPYEPIISGHNG